ncbi:BOP1-like protein [Mya arenaria]|uniref:BOP1-like protein n=1 Tax=Mya arenaria TaxID=6604 RepID=A0ABY7ERJ2_MYAAR|nr:BOP1-like protein [Mya arenaria]
MNCCRFELLRDKKDIRNIVSNILMKWYNKYKHIGYDVEGRHLQCVDWFSSEVMIHPLSNQPEHKSSFIPSKWEKLKVGQMVHALEMGWMKPSKPDDEKDEE